MGHFQQGARDRIYCSWPTVGPRCRRSTRGCLCLALVSAWSAPWGRTSSRALACVAGPAPRLRARLQELRRGWGQGGEGNVPRRQITARCSPTEITSFRILAPVAHTRGAPRGNGTGIGGWRTRALYRFRSGSSLVRHASITPFLSEFPISQPTLRRGVRPEFCWSLPLPEAAWSSD